MALDINTNETIAMAEKAVRESAIERKDAAVLEFLKLQDPDSYRMYLAKAEKAAALPHVKPGDLITADLINALIDRINALEGVGEGVLRLGALALQTHTLIALGGGGAAGVGLWLDGERLHDKEDAVANLALLDGASLSVRLAIVADEASGEAAIARVIKLANKGDVLMAQFTETKQSVDSGENAVAVTISQNHTYLGVIQADNQYLDALQFLNSIQAGQLPFSWGLYNAALKRFVLGGTSEDVRVQQALVRLHQ